MNRLKKNTEKGKNKILQTNDVELYFEWCAWRLEAALKRLELNGKPDLPSIHNDVYVAHGFLELGRKALKREAQSDRT